MCAWCDSTFDQKNVSSIFKYESNDTGIGYETATLQKMLIEYVYQLNQLLLFILLIRGIMSQTFSKGQLLPRPTFGDTGSAVSAGFFILFIISIFSSVYAVEKQTSVLVFHAKQRVCQEISVKCFSQGLNDVMLV